MGWSLTRAMGLQCMTAPSDQGMVDIHDRRPLMLTPENANEWLAPTITPSRA